MCAHLDVVDVLVLSQSWRISSLGAFVGSVRSFVRFELATGSGLAAAHTHTTLCQPPKEPFARPTISPRPRSTS